MTHAVPSHLLPSILESNISKRMAQASEPCVICREDESYMEAPDVRSTTVVEACSSISNHRACSIHTVASVYESKRRITKREAEALRRWNLKSSCFQGKFPSLGRTRQTRHSTAFANGIKNNKLDTNAFHRYFKNMWKQLPENKKLFTAFNCLWFNLYMRPSSKRKVLQWIQRKQVFLKNYVIVPIVCWGHWSLLILCHLREDLHSKSKTPCILLLDSLGIGNPERLEPYVRKFVFDIYKSEGRDELLDSLHKIPFLVPKVPQQRDGEKCGFFVLYFIYLFVQDAPRNFSINGYPYFMKPDWFSPKCMDRFLDRLNRLKNGDPEISNDASD